MLLALWASVACGVRAAPPPASVFLGAPVSDRATWTAWAERLDRPALLQRAEQEAAKPFPAMEEEAYAAFKKTGDRLASQRIHGAQVSRLETLFWAEAVEYKGRFIPALVETIDGFARERTWVMAAHHAVVIDLRSSAMAWRLATIDRVLGDRLPTAARQTLRAEVRRRVLDPFAAMIRGERRADWWLAGNNNWNTVCLAGVAGASLAIEEDPETRAQTLDAAVRLSQNFLKGFTADGYCSEGVGYWSYGFGHYMLLVELATRACPERGAALCDRPVARAAAEAVWNLELADNLFPTFSDCSSDARPQAWIGRAARRAWPDFPHYGGLEQSPGSLGLYQLELGPETETAERALPPRSHFPSAGVLVVRPAPGAGEALAAAMKGGHNAEHHNHNDLGSYLVAHRGVRVLADTGAMVYTARTFGAHRYDSAACNSWGHPVPVVAGQQQRTGREAAAKVIETTFTPDRDVFRLNLAPGYAVPALRTLERTFVYDRAELGALTVRDAVVFTKPSSFETALVTWGEAKEVAPGRLEIRDGRGAVRVVIEAGGEKFSVRMEPIKENFGGRSDQPTRVGIALDRPVESGVIQVRIEPLP